MDIEVNDSAINSFLIEGFSKNIPLIDIFILLSKQVNDIKKITFYHDPINYISNNSKCQVDFSNHDSLLKAKLILNAQNLNNLFNSKEPKIRISECQLNRSNLVNESVSQTTALMFENMQINNINILEFIFHLKKFINLNNENEKSKYKITKIRQYSNRILVIFEPNVPENIKQYLRKGENELLPQIPYFDYKGKNIPIIPKMKPAVNIGKYKEKYIKLSVHNLNEEDCENLFSIFEKNQDSNNNDDNLLINKMAENAFNNILNKEKLMRDDKIKKNNINNNSLNKKRERERNREKIPDKEKERRERDRDRDLMNRDKMRDNRNNRDIKINRRDRDIRERRDKNRDYNNRNINEERREDSSSDRDRKGDNINMNNNYRNKGNNNNSINYMEGKNMFNSNNNNNINNNLSGLNINEKDLNQVASLFSNANAVNIVKYLLENNAFNNINPKNNNNQNINNNINNNIGNINNMSNNNLMQNKIPMKINEASNTNNNNINNLLKNNYNEAFNNIYNQTQNQNNISNNVNYQQLINVLQSQTQGGIINNNKNNQPQPRMNNNFQNVMNINQMMRMDNNNSNNLINNNYFNNQRQFQFPLNEQYMNQFSSFNAQQKRKNNENN